MTDTEKLITTVIKGRQVTYYLTTEEDLNNVKSNSLLGDIFAVLTSLAIGGIISILLTKAIDIELQKQTLNILDILLYVFIAGVVIFGVFLGYFYYRTFRTLEKIKESGAVKSFKGFDQENTDLNSETQKATKLKDNKLEIIKATYGTPKAESDVTEELRQRIVDNKLETVASNDIKNDPDFGTVKNLSIEYKFGGIIVAKEFTEGNRVVIP